MFEGEAGGDELVAFGGDGLGDELVCDFCGGGVGFEEFAQEVELGVCVLKGLFPCGAFCFGEVEEGVYPAEVVFGIGRSWDSVFG